MRWGTLPRSFATIDSISWVGSASSAAPTRMMLWWKAGAMIKLDGPLENVPTSVTMRCPKMPRLPGDALGGRCDADLVAQGGAEASQARLVLTAPNLDAQVPLSLGEEVAVEGATVRYRPPARLAERIVAAAGSA